MPQPRQRARQAVSLSPCLPTTILSTLRIPYPTSTTFTRLLLRFLSLSLSHSDVARLVQGPGRHHHRRRCRHRSGVSPPPLILLLRLVGSQERERLTLETVVSDTRSTMPSSVPRSSSTMSAQSRPRPSSTRSSRVRVAPPGPSSPSPLVSASEPQADNDDLPSHPPRLDP